MLIASAAAPGSAHAAEAAAGSWDAIYRSDVVSYDGGPGRRGGATVDLLSIAAEADLETWVGAPGWRAGVHVENSSGGEPNARLDTLRGVNNSEVSRPRLRLYEAWISKSFADGRLEALVGLYDFNSEFYATQATGVFLGPGFGIGTEMAVTGPNGPSIYPSTGLAIRLRADLGGGYLQGAAINAHVGVPGDPGGIDLTYDEGLLLASEGGVAGARGRLAVGAWIYTAAVAPTAPGKARRSRGAYLLAEGKPGGESGRATAFLRVGVSDGETTPVAGGFQAGLTVSPAIPGREASVFGIGVDHARFSGPERHVRRAASVAVGRGETGLEITYADRVTDWLTVQPNLQFIFDPQGDSARDVATVFSIRFTATLQGRIDGDWPRVARQGVPYGSASPYRTPTK